MSKNSKTPPPGYEHAYGVKGRAVFSPNPVVRDLHKQFLKTVFYGLKMPTIRSCIKPHLKNRFYLKFDIRDAYGSISAFGTEVVLNVDFEGLERYFFHQSGGLIQGAVASPYIFEAYCIETIDVAMKNLASKHSLVYTRYCDDLLFSSQKYIRRGIRQEIYGAIRSEFFELQARKTAVRDNKYQFVEVLGCKILKGKVRESDESVKNLENSTPGSKRYDGLLAWRRYARSINK